MSGTRTWGKWVVWSGLAVGVGLASSCWWNSADRPPPSSASPSWSAQQPTPSSSPAELGRTWHAPLDTRGARTSRYLWWEAERPTRTDFPKHHPFEPATDAEAAVLSGGAWVGASDAGRKLFLEYEVDVSEAATYQLFARKFWSHGPFRWRFDDGPWRVCGTSVALLDEAPLRLHVVANWVELGDVELPSGAHTFRIELLESDGAVAFDAFVLTRDGFTPRGKLKPTASYGAAPEGWVTFDPPSDNFTPTPLDQRALNQEQAGAGGFIRARNGEFLIEGSGERLRFWGMNAGHGVLQLSPEGMRRYARRQAKYGVNLVRLHGPIWREDAFREFDQEKLDRIHRFAAALREQGIYLALSVYFPVWMQIGQNDGFPGYSGQQPFSLAYFSPEFQKVQRGWWRSLLTTVNPHTGLSLAKDPALAMVELVNEDSTLFWTFQPYGTIPMEQSADLERQFGAWLSKKYGDLGATYARWESEPANNDNVAAGRIAFMGLWEMATERHQRAQDTAEFLSRSMRDYYADMQAFLRKELGLEALTVCSNWQTADQRILGPLDDWANSVCDVMDRHGYHSGVHEGEAATYAVRAGNEYEDRSALRIDFSPKPEGQEQSAGLSMPFVEARVNGKPSVVSELGWTWPNRFRAEGPLMTSVYSSLHGLDGPMFFATEAMGWENMLGKFTVSDPATMGVFPAAARAFRKRMVRTAEPVVRGSLTQRSLFALNGVPLASIAALDNLRAKDVPLERTPWSQEKGIDPLAFLIGPIDFEFAAKEDRLQQDDLDAWVDLEKSTVRSKTDELLLNYETGVLEVKAPSLEAVAGFLGSVRTVELPTMRLEIENEYATVALVALDDVPLSESASMLLQVVTEVRNSHWEAHGRKRKTIKDPGGPPLLLRAVHGSFEFTRPDASELKVTALDANGHPTRRRRDGVTRTPMLPGTMYYLIER